MARTRTVAQKLRRVQLYKQARDAGLSPTQARYYRDHGASRQRQVVQRVRQRARQRDRDDTLSDARLREHTSTGRQQLRHEAWAAWSKMKDFPFWLQARIAQINADYGNQDYDPFGYQVAYREYVYAEEYDDAVADAQAGFYVR
jgi:hypothetical protein